MDRWRTNKNHKVGDWCCYGHYSGYWGFGRITSVSSDGGHLVLIYSERSEDHYWDAEWVDVYPSVDEAAAAYCESARLSDLDAERLIHRQFPKERIIE